MGVPGPLGEEHCIAAAGAALSHDDDIAYAITQAASHIGRHQYDAKAFDKLLKMAEDENNKIYFRSRVAIIHALAKVPLSFTSHALTHHINTSHRAPRCTPTGTSRTS